MLKKLTIIAKDLHDFVRFDPSSLKDPIAMRTEWTPLSGIALNHRKLTQVNADRLEFRASTETRLSSIFLFMIGVLALALVAYSTFLSGIMRFDVANILFIVFFVVVMSLGINSLHFYATPLIIERNGCIRKGKKLSDRFKNQDNSKILADLDQIYALQLLFDSDSGNDEGYKANYQLNFVLTDSTRINVAIYNSYDELRQDANTVSSFLNKPVWDAMF